MTIYGMSCHIVSCELLSDTIKERRFCEIGRICDVFVSSALFLLLNKTGLCVYAIIVPEERFGGFDQIYFR